MTEAHATVLPESCYPAVWIWPGHGLYSGPSLELRPHSGSVWCLVVGVDADVTVTSRGQRVVSRSVLIPPRRLHHLDTHGGRLISCYLDPTSNRVEACRQRCRDAADDGLAVDHVDRDRLTTPPSDGPAARLWVAAAAPTVTRSMDHRVAQVILDIRANPIESTPSRALAAQVGLSESRLLHLFREQTGTSLRRYRSWARLMRAGAVISSGGSMTTAAVEAGFASPSHFSDRFTATFGMTASRLLNHGTRLHVMWE